jgi:uncharacterized membrane protein
MYEIIHTVRHFSVINFGVAKLQESRTWSRSVILLSMKSFTPFTSRFKFRLQQELTVTEMQMAAKLLWLLIVHLLLSCYSYCGSNRSTNMYKHNILVTFTLAKEIIKIFLYMISFTVCEPQFCNSLSKFQCLWIYSAGNALICKRRKEK